MVKPVLLFGYGNLSRGDDALGPLLLEFVESHFDLTYIELLTDFQLQIEHALDLEHRSLVLFIDASVADIDSFTFTELIPSNEIGYTTHAMSPEALMRVYQSIKQSTLPNCFMLAIKGNRFELGEEISDSAGRNLAKACRFVGLLLNEPTVEYWRRALLPQCNDF
jgi:hydrogenase maturation protease